MSLPPALQQAAAWPGKVLNTRELHDRQRGQRLLRTTWTQARHGEQRNEAQDSSRGLHAVCLLTLPGAALPASDSHSTSKQGSWPRSNLACLGATTLMTAVHRRSESGLALPGVPTACARLSRMPQLAPQPGRRWWAGSQGTAQGCSELRLGTPKAASPPRSWLV